MKKVSVVMPVFVCADYQVKFVKLAIESIVNQTYKNWELIIVNDGSQIDFKDIIPNDERIKYFEKEHGGTAKARNFGLKKMTGDYYTAQDSDDSSSPERLEKMVEKMEEADVVYSDFYVCSMDGTNVKLRETGDFDIKSFCENPNVPYFVMVKKEKLVPYKDKYTVNDDWVFIIDLYLNGAKFLRINEPLLIYRLNPLSVSVISTYDGRKVKERKWVKDYIKNKI